MIDNQLGDDEVAFLKTQYDGQDSPERVCLDELLARRVIRFEDWKSEREVALEVALKELVTHVRTNDGLEVIHRMKLAGLV